MRTFLTGSRFSVLLLIVAATVVMSGCWVTSMEPYFEKTDHLADPRLMGSWSDKCTETETCTVTIAEGTQPKSLQLTFEHPKGKENFEAYVAELGGQRFLQLLPSDTSLELGHIRPVYTVWRIGVEKETLSLTPISADWFEEEFKAGRIKPAVSALRTQIFDDEMIVMLTFTASTKELQEFLKANLANEKMYGKTISLRRQR